MQLKAKVVIAPALAIARALAVALVCLTAVQLVVTHARGLAAIHATTVVRVHATDVKPLKDKMGIFYYSHLVSFCFGKYKDDNFCCN